LSNTLIDLFVIYYLERVMAHTNRSRVFVTVLNTIQCKIVP